MRWTSRTRRTLWRRMILTCLAVLVLIGCQRTAQEEEQSNPEVIHIPVIFTVDPNTGNRENEELVTAFNEAYEGVYFVDVKWILETEEEYRQNLKRLNVTDSLPAVITDLAMLPAFYQTMIADHRIVDLRPYIEADSEWQAVIEESTLAACTETDGGIYLLNNGSSVFTCSGMFWNEELFQQVGVDTFPATWEEFWELCEQLERQGITPLALHTEGTGWAPLLIATAQAAADPVGYEFLQESLPETYQNASGRQIAETIKRLFEYTTENAMHADFDAAYLNFFSGNTAMLPNGHWMIADIGSAWQDTIRFSAFPGNVLISSPETFGWAIAEGYSEEVKEGAAAFLKFRTLQAQQSKVEFLDQNREEPQAAVRDYIAAFLGEPTIVPNYQVKWNSILQEKTLGACLPLLISGEMSTEDFLQEADRSITEYNQER